MFYTSKYQLSAFKNCENLKHCTKPFLWILIKASENLDAPHFELRNKNNMLTATAYLT